MREKKSVKRVVRDCSWLQRFNVVISSANAAAGCRLIGRFEENHFYENYSDYRFSIGLKV